MLLFDVVGKGKKVAPEQILATGVKVGVVLSEMVKSLKQLVVPSVIVALYVTVLVGFTVTLKGDVVPVAITAPVAKLVIVIVLFKGVPTIILSNPQLSVTSEVAFSWCHLNFVFVVFAAVGIGTIIFRQD